jgi:hypothetical protein
MVGKQVGIQSLVGLENRSHVNTWTSKTIGWQSKVLRLKCLQAWQREVSHLDSFNVCDNIS